MSRRSKKSAFRSTFEEDVNKILKGFDYNPSPSPTPLSAVIVLTLFIMPLVFSSNVKDTLETETLRSTPASETVCQENKSLSSY